MQQVKYYKKRKTKIIFHLFSISYKYRKLFFLYLPAYAASDMYFKVLIWQTYEYFSVSWKAKPVYGAPTLPIAGQ